MRRALAALIRGYRRWVSGRGPLRGVRCSFAGVESCSAYGLRATQEAPSAGAAIGRIARRLRRCRDAWLIADGRTLSWARIHDRPAAAIAEAMARDGESPAAIERMLEARRTVAVWRSEASVASRPPSGRDGRAAPGKPDRQQSLLTEKVTSSQQQAARPTTRPLVCSHPAAQARARRRIAGFALLAGVAAFAVVFRPVLGAVVLAIALAAAAVATRTYAERAVRFALHAAVGRRAAGGGKVATGTRHAGAAAARRVGSSALPL